MVDEWSGFAELLTNLIEKYVSDLEIDDLPDSKVIPIAKDDFIMQMKVADKTAA